MAKSSGGAGCLTIVVIVVGLGVAFGLWNSHRDAQRVASIDQNISDLLARTSAASALSLERREDLERAKAAFGATVKVTRRPSDKIFRNNAAVMFWLLRDGAKASSLIREQGADAYDEGFALTAFVVTGDKAYDKEATSETVRAQRVYNNPDAGTEDLRAVAGNNTLSPRLRAKVLCRLGVKLASGIETAYDRKAAVSESTALFTQAVALDPNGAVGRMAAENIKRLEAWTEARRTKARRTKARR